MPRNRITKVVVTTEDGREHRFDGAGEASIMTTTMKEGNQARARLEVLMPLESEWRSGSEGRYIALKTPSTMPF